MNIVKFIKDKNNKYKVLIDDEEYKLYEDTIIEYGLLTKKTITEKELNDILTADLELSSYYDSIKYINIRIRSEKEIREYLKKKDVNETVINKTIKLLKDNKFINEELYLKAFINDKINLSQDGPLKIKRDLIKLGINEDDIDDYLSNISNDVWTDRIDNIISKKVNNNSKYSSYNLKAKILMYLTNLGYYKEDIMSILNRYDIIDKDIYIKEKEKAYKELSKKYSGYELDQKVNARLYRKGFKGSGLYED